jgi:hypothetical protein
MWDFVMDKSGAGAGFLRELRFPLPIYIPSASPPSSSLSIEAGTIGQEWPQCQYSLTNQIKKREISILFTVETGIVCSFERETSCNNMVHGIDGYA